MVPFIKDIIFATIGYCNDPSLYESLANGECNEVEGNKCEQRRDNGNVKLRFSKG